MKKVYGSAAEALDGLLHDGMLIAAGGFGLCGIPELLIEAIVKSGKTICRAISILCFTIDAPSKRGSIIPDVGKISSFNENSKITIKPTQNVGIAMPRKDNTLTT